MRIGVQFSESIEMYKGFSVGFVEEIRYKNTDGLV